MATYSASVRHASFAPLEVRGRRHIGTARMLHAGDYEVFTALCGWYAPQWDITENAELRSPCRRCLHLNGGRDGDH